MSGVERLTYPDGESAVFKYATEPLTHEDQILRIAARCGVPVPRVIGSVAQRALLGMVLEDLGEPLHEPRDAEAVVAAVHLHRLAIAPCLPVLDASAMAALPLQALRQLRLLRESGRWIEGTEDLTVHLEALARVAPIRAKGATTEPFGWVHSEFEPASLHIGANGWRLLDFARTFTGPGLLDLASWKGLAKAQPPDPTSLRALIKAYITAGGSRDVLAYRGGLPPEDWALGWHRIWAVTWFLEQAHVWIRKPDRDPGSIKVVRRHLADAVALLRA
ncbi:phosphotransferase [Streptacidiphilus sp. P02-A3a]|uniref:phosphotransferase n=1 Tax=Streptacidiphilus sp. P02-A3a TaxID=2704468 RepID=UPI0015FDC921|nr:phosphotransferase [Streptacidiphilus sp. P02-A3a]QMU67088.1 phosphotransferase [Streptacidiphilus sp. P02-A3a]